MCELFLERGADIDATDCMGRIPLWYALMGSHLDCIFLLVRLGSSFPDNLRIDKMFQAGCHKLAIKIGKMLKRCYYATLMVRTYPRRQDIIKTVRSRIDEIGFQVLRERDNGVPI